MNETAEVHPCTPRLADASVIDNVRICREHFRLVLGCEIAPGAQPGQFVHLCPLNPWSGDDWQAATGTSWAPSPLLRRAFSIAGLRERDGGLREIDVIYRVVGTATRWMESLRRGQLISILGPLGNAFPISTTKSNAWMIAGGVGLPPMLWLAQSLHAASRRSVAIVGARSADLLPLTITHPGTIAADASRATPAAKEFAAFDTPVVVATDDGSIGLRGHVPAALTAYWNNTNVNAGDLVVYTCGPEAMMEAVARFCIDRSIECHVCMERSMACGTGTCQSCVVAVRHESAVNGWRYELCCTQGPVFDATRVIWR